MARIVAFAPAGPFTSPPCPQSWSELMGLALQEAKLAEAEGEMPVGAILLDAQGNLVARGHNTCIQKHDITAHAEIVVLRQAGRYLANYRLNGCVLISTLEPCAMCAAAIVQARLEGLVYGATDTLAGAVTSCAEYLDWPACKGSPVWHLSGIRSAECAALLQNFFAHKRQS